jgi:hypothetical protein
MDYQFTLLHNGNRTVLTRDPEGWEDIALTLTRDENWHGISQEVSVDLGFWCDGGGFEIIDAEYETNGADVEIILEVLYCGQLVFNGLLQLNSLIRRRCVLNVPVDNFDVGVKIRRRIETPINLEQPTTLDSGNVNNYNYGGYDVNMHSRTIYLKSQLQQLDPFTRSTSKEFFVSATYLGWLTHAILQTNGDLGTMVDNISYYNIVQGSAPLEDSGIQPFYTANDPIVEYPLSIDVSWDFAGTYTDFMPTPQTPQDRGIAGDLGMVLAWGQTLDNLDGFTVLCTINYSSNARTITELFNGSGNTVLNLNAGDRVWLYWGLFNGSGYSLSTGVGGVAYVIDWTWVYDYFRITFESNTGFSQTPAKAWAIHELFSRLTHATSNEPSSFRSNYFGRTNSQPVSYPITGCGGYTAITNGLKLRQYEDERSAIVVSIQDLLDSMDSLHGIGWAVLNNKMIVEPIEYFYQSTIVKTLNNVPFFEMRIAQSKYVNEIQIGYEKWETEDVNGLEEPNSIHSYSLPKVQRKNRIDKISPYIGGSYAIETTRRRPQNIFTTFDWKFDTDNFILALKHNVNELNVCEKDENFSNVANLLEPDTTYNLRYSPARNLLRQLKAYTGGLFRKPLEDVRFQSGEGNITLEATELTNCLGNFDGTLLVENQDFVSGDFAPYWIPEIYTFDYVLSFSEFVNIRNSPYGLIAFSETDKDYIYGYIINLEYNLKTGAASFELLRANV